MKAEYYETRGWVDGVVPDEKLEALGIDIGPGTGVSAGDSAAPPTTERSLPAVGFFWTATSITEPRAPPAYVPESGSPFAVPSIAVWPVSVPSIPPVSPSVRSPSGQSRRSLLGTVCAAAASGFAGCADLPGSEELAHEVEIYNRRDTAHTLSVRIENADADALYRRTFGSTATASERGPSRSPGRRRRSS